VAAQLDDRDDLRAGDRIGPADLDRAVASADAAEQALDAARAGRDARGDLRACAEPLELARLVVGTAGDARDEEGRRACRI
jgi:hypothetical protein